MPVLNTFLYYLDVCFSVFEYAENLMTFLDWNNLSTSKPLYVPTRYILSTGSVQLSEKCRIKSCHKTCLLQWSAPVSRKVSNPSILINQFTKWIHLKNLFVSITKKFTLWTHISMVYKLHLRVKCVSNAVFYSSTN